MYQREGIYANTAYARGAYAVRYRLIENRFEQSSHLVYFRLVSSKGRIRGEVEYHILGYLISPAEVRLVAEFGPVESSVSVNVRAVVGVTECEDSFVLRSAALAVAGDNYEVALLFGTERFNLLNGFDDAVAVYFDYPLA